MERKADELIQKNPHARFSSKAYIRNKINEIHQKGSAGSQYRYTSGKGSQPTASQECVKIDPPLAETHLQRIHKKQQAIGQEHLQLLFVRHATSLAKTGSIAVPGFLDMPFSWRTQLPYVRPIILHSAYLQLPSISSSGQIKGLSYFLLLLHYNWTAPNP